MIARERGLEHKHPEIGQVTESASSRSDTWWAIPAAALLFVVCCAGPLLLGALVATGAGAWLASHGFQLGATALMVVAAILAVAAWLRIRRA